MTSRRAVLLLLLAVSVALLVAALVRTQAVDERPGPAANLNIVVLGVDGLDWFLLGRYMEDDSLPNIRRIFNSAIQGEIDPDRPVLPHAGWTIVGRGGPLTASEAETMESEGYPRLFGVVPDVVRIVEDYGGNAIAIGWPASWPLPAGDQPAVAPYSPEAPGHPFALAPALFEGAPDQTSDPALGEIVDSAVRRNLGLLDSEFAADIHDGGASSAQTEEGLAAVRWGYLADRITLDVAGRVIAERQPDLSLVYLGGLDAAMHRFLAPAMPDYFEETHDVPVECADVVPNYYRFIDEAFGRLLRLADNRTLFILCSVYGVHPSTQSPPATGGHELGPPGVLLVRGPKLPTSGQTLSLTTADLAPTILAGLGLPIPSRMTGRPLVDMLPQGVVANHPPRFADAPGKLAESMTAPPELRRMEQLVGERMRATEVGRNP